MSPSRALGSVGWLLLASSTALASDEPPVTVSANGHVKSFALATVPYDHVLMPASPTGQGVLDARLNLGLQYKKLLRFEVAHAVTSLLGSPASSLGVAQTGVAIEAPEALPLSWAALDEPDSTFSLTGRTDRLLVKLRVPHLDLTLGRQPISFGTGLFFTPLDLVNPFTPATIDSEYKPGVDAFRVDGFVGVSTRLTAVAAYAGDWSLEGTTFALNGQTTVGVTDLGLFYGLVQADHVIGATAVSGIGPIGIHADAAVTIPASDDEDVFFRGVLGADGRPTNTTSIFGEVYVQTFGTTDYSEYLNLVTSDRFARGEVWTVGLLYAGLGISQEIVPTFTANLSVLSNVLDPSAFLAPGINWSVAEEADVIAGGYIGLGKRPEEVDILALLDPQADLGIRSEFGVLPTTFFVQVRTYF